jgi:cell division protein FtsZ
MIDFEVENPIVLSPSVRISVLGVGGAGGNTINALLMANYENVFCAAVNTDLKALEVSKSPNKLQIGVKSAKGLGSGANPELGKRSAEEDLPEIIEMVKNSDIVFLVGGLGGGTGSGALPVIARALKEKDLLTIAVVTKPFAFEGNRRMKIADEAELLLRKEVDTLITIPNEKLLSMTDKQLSLVDAFEMINGIISQFVKSVADIINRPGYINVDFADLKSIMKGMGLAVMGTATASGENRAQEAAFAAITSPLLNDMSIKGARSVLINVTGSSDLGLKEVSEAASFITREAHEDANIILGSVIDEAMGDEVSVTVIATGFAPVVEKAAQPVIQKVEPTFMQDAMEKRVVETSAVVYTEKVEARAEAPVVAAQHPLKDLLLTEKTVDSTSSPRADLTGSRAESIKAAGSGRDLEVPTLLRKMVQEKRLQQKN